jgi:hypothetical protein
MDSVHGTVALLHNSEPIRKASQPRSITPHGRGIGGIPCEGCSLSRYLDSRREFPRRVQGFSPSDLRGPGSYA